MPYARKDEIDWSPNSYYHIYNRGVHQTSIFREQDNYLFVLQKVRKYSRDLRVTVIAYCLMPTHYHFLLRQDGDKPAGLLPQFVFNSYTKAYNKRYEHSGTLFEARYKAKQVGSYSYLLHLCRYIHGNPVKDGLAAEPHDWPYSNYHEWTDLRNGALVDRNFIREHFGSPQEYRDLVYDYLRSRQLPEDVAKYLQSLESTR